jgi:hypothetical protein
MTAKLEKAVQSVHRANIEHCRKLLMTNLTDHERELVERRLGEEQKALRKASRNDPPADRAVG